MHLSSNLRRTLPLAVTLTLLCCSVEKVLAERVPSAQFIGYIPLKTPNACLPDSIGFRSAYEVFQRARSQHPWSRLLLVYQRTGRTVRAHAYCVFSAEGKLWTYDQVSGSRRVWLTFAERNDAEKLGRQLAGKQMVRAAWVDSML